MISEVYGLLIDIDLSRVSDKQRRNSMNLHQPKSNGCTIAYNNQYTSGYTNIARQYNGSSESSPFWSSARLSEKIDLSTSVTSNRLDTLPPRGRSVGPSESRRGYTGVQINR
ncbi:unnamed protein product [Protopolystoma xenopodis]|uniref:Uncharacterized protein n=1 Tax=Protopolystoma xenopodis TaxID=117903 RepID=A0A448WSE3_9PLAT|nr:unnamed protein product [Protopolystoma xenopodis]